MIAWLRAEDRPVISAITHLHFLGGCGAGKSVFLRTMRFFPSVHFEHEYEDFNPFEGEETVILAFTSTPTSVPCSASSRVSGEPSSGNCSFLPAQD